MKKKDKIFKDLMHNKVWVGKRTKWVIVSYWLKTKDGYASLPLHPIDETISELRIVKPEKEIFNMPL